MSNLKTVTLNIEVLDNSSNEDLTQKIKDALKHSNNFTEASKLVFIETDEAEDSEEWEYIFMLYKQGNLRSSYRKFRQLKEEEQEALMHYIKDSEERSEEFIEFIMLEAVSLTNDEEDITIECPMCDNWECLPLDQKRTDLQTFELKEWFTNEEDTNEVSIMECSCKHKFLQVWNYQNI